MSASGWMQMSEKRLFGISLFYFGVGIVIAAIAFKCAMPDPGMPASLAWILGTGGICMVVSIFLR